MVNPRLAAIRVQGFWSAEWSQPQPRSSGKPFATRVCARPPTAGSRLQDDEREARGGEPLAGGEARGSRPNHDDVEIAQRS